jgi:hypothetical protein
MPNDILKMMWKEAVVAYFKGLRMTYEIHVREADVRTDKRTG